MEENYRLGKQKLIVVNYVKTTFKLLLFKNSIFLSRDMKARKMNIIWFTWINNK